jgi:dTDP-4-amino-4,6-dideoxygalactose transaminase
MNPFKVVQMFEEAVAEYTGSPYAVAVDSCTNALFLCCKYLEVKEVTIPSKTYLSVPQSIIHAGGEVIFDKRMNDWTGIYNLYPYPIWDAAKRFTSRMYIPYTYMCLSFHIKKILDIGKGGMILTDNKEAVDWFKKARYEGRSEMFYLKDDSIDSLGWNMYMTPEQAARGLYLMQNIPLRNSDLTEGYRDLTEFKLFKHNKVIKDDYWYSSSTSLAQ